MSSSTNPGFAFVVNNILTSSKSAKLLSKAKKDVELVVETINNKRAAEDDFEVVDETGNVSRAQETTGPKTKKLKRKKKRSNLSKHDEDMVGRAKIKPEERAHERQLNAIATKGVVQLFNIVRDQKRKIKTQD